MRKRIFAMFLVMGLLLGLFSAKEATAAEIKLETEKNVYYSFAAEVVEKFYRSKDLAEKK